MGGSSATRRRRPTPPPTYINVLQYRPHDLPADPSPASPRRAALPRSTGWSDRSTRPCEPCSAATRPPGPTRPRTLAETVDQPTERRHAAALMRVNHSGEVAAQALYQGQAAVAGSPSTRAALTGGGARGNRPPRLVRGAHPGTGRPHQPAQSAVVCGLVRDRRPRGTRRRPHQPRLRRGNRAPGGGAPRRTPASAAANGRSHACDRATNERGRRAPRSQRDECRRRRVARVGARDDEGDRANHDAHRVLAVAVAPASALAIRSVLY